MCKWSSLGQVNVVVVRARGKMRYSFPVKLDMPQQFVSMAVMISHSSEPQELREGFRKYSHARRADQITEACGKLNTPLHARLLGLRGHVARETRPNCSKILRLLHVKGFHNHTDLHPCFLHAWRRLPDEALGPGYKKVAE